MLKEMLPVLAIALCMTGCSGSSRNEPKSAASSGWEEGAITERSVEKVPPPADQEPAVQAELEPAAGAEIAGEAKFFPEPDGVRVLVEVEDAPAGPMAVHIHENGDCGAIEAATMGAPESASQVLAEEEVGNLQVGPDGKGRLEAKVDGVSLDEGDPNSVRGRAIVVQSQAGQGQGQVTQPSFGAATALACAVIE